MTPEVPDHRLAICRRCRNSERIAAGADGAQLLLDHARATGTTPDGHPFHARLSQCLNSCDAGHTVRVEWQGWEFAFVGIRTCDELDEVIGALAEIAAQKTPEQLRKRLYQVWFDGRLQFHAGLRPPIG
jgi:predicted metal-binding protein